MGEFNVFGVQVEAVGSSTVERVADDGGIEAITVGAVHTQLVGASRLGIQRYEGRAMLCEGALHRRLGMRDEAVARNG